MLRSMCLLRRGKSSRSEHWTRCGRRLESTCKNSLRHCRSSLASRARGQKLGHLCAPSVQAACHRRIAHALSLLRPVAVQEVFDREHPAVHALDLRQLLCPGGPLGHDRLQARQLLHTARAYSPPFFESCCRLASTSSNRSAASTVAYLKGSSPSVLRAVKIPAA